MSSRTIVHLMRHGEVHNPDGVLYGRLPEYFLSDLGHKMAEAAADFLSKNEIIHLVSSPLERAQQTAEPLSKILEVEITTDDRVIEAENLFEGRTFGVGDGALRRPANWWKLRNPFRPSWGEPYTHIAERMRAAIADAREAARGHEAVIVSHQLPVWIARRSFEQKSFVHDPAQAAVLPRQHHQPDVRRRPLRRLHLQRAGRPPPSGGAEERQEVRRRSMRAALLLAAAAVLAGCSGVGTEGSTGGYVSGNGSITVVPAKDREKAPTLAGDDLEGRRLSTADFEGDTLVVNVWGSWCPPCRKEAPDLAEVSKQYADRDVTFVGVLVRDKPAAALAFTRKQETPYRSIADFSGRTLLGFAESLPSQAIPTTWIIDDRGRVAVRIMDEVSASTLAGLIDDVREAGS